MRLRNLALGITAVGLLAVATAAPSLANPAPAPDKKIEGTVAFPLPELGRETTKGDGAHPLVCPHAGEGDGLWYKFLDLKETYTRFTLKSSATVLREPDPTGDPAGLTGGTINEFDIDIWAYDAKCNHIDVTGNLMTAAGEGVAIAGKPAKYIVVSYFAGPHLNIPFEVVASNKKK